MVSTILQQFSREKLLSLHSIFQKFSSYLNLKCVLTFVEIYSVHTNRRLQISDTRIEIIVKRVRKKTKTKTFLKRNLPPRKRRPIKEVENRQQQRRQLKTVKKRKKRKTNPKRGVDERVCSARNATGEYKTYTKRKSTRCFEKDRHRFIEKRKFQQISLQYAT